MIGSVRKVYRQARTKIKFWFERKTVDNFFTVKNPHHHDTIQTNNEMEIQSKRKYWIQITLYYILEYFIVLLCLAFIFPVLFSGIPTYSNPYFRLNDPSLSYPITYNSSGTVYENLPLWFLAVIMVFAIPICTFVIFQVMFVRNVPDFHHALLGYIQTISLAMAMVSFGWLCYGSYRPTFLQDCQPDMSKVTNAKPDVFVNIVQYFKPYQICKDPTRFSLGSPSQTPAFPSGHVASVMSVWVFFLLYYAAKANTWNRRRGQFFKVLLFCLLFLVPLWVGLSRIVTLKHTIFQAVMGGLIGILSALLVYRYKFCSLFGIDAKTPNYYLWNRLYPPKQQQQQERPSSQQHPMMISSHSNIIP